MHTWHNGTSPPSPVTNLGVKSVVSWKLKWGYLKYDTSLLVPAAFVVFLKRVSLSDMRRTVCSPKNAPPSGKRWNMWEPNTLLCSLCCLSACARVPLSSVPPSVCCDWHLWGRMTVINPPCLRHPHRVKHSKQSFSPHFTRLNPPTQQYGSCSAVGSMLIKVKTMKICNSCAVCKKKCNLLWIFWKNALVHVICDSFFLQILLCIQFMHITIW